MARCRGMLAVICEFRLPALTLFVACTSAGCGGGSSAPASAAPAPTATLASSVADAATNGSVTLSWSSTNASSCTASGSWVGAVATSGSQSVVVKQNSTYSLSCAGAGGSATASVMVTATPMVLTVTVQYQRPGPPIVNSAGTYYVPDWAHPVVAPVPYVFVEVDDPKRTYRAVDLADANGVARFTGPRSARAVHPPDSIAHAISAAGRGLRGPQQYRARRHEPGSISLTLPQLLDFLSRRTRRAIWSSRL